MSLINDALKRANQVPTPQAPPSPGPQLRPVEPAQRRGRGLGLMIPVALGVLALLALLFAGWIHIQRGAAQQRLVPSQPVQAATTPAPAGAETASTAPTPAPVTPAPSVAASSAPATAPAPVPARVPAAVTAPAPASGAPAELAPAPASSNVVAQPAVAAPAAATPVAPAEPVYRLQAIVAHPTRPSAIINGRTLFIGDKIGAFRLISITTDTAKLVGGGRTNVLELIQ